MAVAVTGCYNMRVRTLDIISESLDHALRAAVESVVGCYGGAIADIWRGTDHDDDDSIFVEVVYTRPDVAVDPARTASLNHVLRKVASDLGERAILYVHNSFPSDQKIDEAAMERILGREPPHRPRT